MVRNSFFMVLVVVCGLLFNTAVVTAELGAISLSGYDPTQSMASASQVTTLDHDTSVKEANALFGQRNDPVAGNAQGKVTLVEFFDYQCSHCINMRSTIDALIKDNPNLRVVFKDFPISGDVSLYAAKAALAANKQGKYLVLHDMLLKSGASLTENKVLALAASAGVDTKKLKEDMNSSEVDQQIKAIYQLAQTLQLQGTPAFYVGRTVMPATPSASIDFINGQVMQQVLQQAIFNKMK
jgi:protein-disulfide isomerase